ncbi:MAG: hypothetical protein H7836_07975 [Magnetococcus sp. YQC-3]
MDNYLVKICKELKQYYDTIYFSDFPLILVLNVNDMSIIYGEEKIPFPRSIEKLDELIDIEELITKLESDLIEKI